MVSIYLLTHRRRYEISSRSAKIVDAILTSTFDPQNTRSIAISDRNQFDQFLFEHMFNTIWIQIFVQMGMLLFQFEERAHLERDETIKNDVSFNLCY